MAAAPAVKRPLPQGGPDIGGSQARLLPLLFGLLKDSAYPLDSDHAMRSLALPLSLLLIFNPGRASAQEPVTSCLTVPDELAGFRLTNTKVYPDSANGTAYTFTDASSDRVTVFIYPFSPAARVAPDLHTSVAAEGASFKNILSVGIQRRAWQTYTVMVDEPDSVAVANEHIPGYLVIGGTRRGGTVTVEFQYLFGICDHFVKMRASVDSQTWTESAFPQFARDLAAYLRQH